MNEGYVTGVTAVSTHSNSLNPAQSVVVISLFYSECDARHREFKTHSESALFTLSYDIQGRDGGGTFMPGTWRNRRKDFQMKLMVSVGNHMF